MRLIRRFIPFVLVLVLILVVWVWWNRPKKVDMATYVPADALLYIETNSLPQIANGLTHTNAWNVLAGPAGIRPGLGNAGWLSRLATWMGIGSADTIVFSRMQVAAVVLGVTASDGGESLNIKPRVALVIETHAGDGRTLDSIEKHVGNFARRAYSDPRVERKDVDGTKWIIWSSITSERRIVAAVFGSVAIIGNHEAAVQACLAVRRGQRPSLAGNLEMEESRQRFARSDALAFGFISSQGAANLFEVAAAVYIGQISDDAATQGIAANILPQIAKKIIGSVAWSTRLVNGCIEDEYFVSTTNDAGARLRSALVATSANYMPAAAFMPSDTNSITRYSTRETLAAWRGLSLSVSSQLDPLLAVMVQPFLKATLTPYGIDEPDQFMQSVGPNVVTARVDTGGNNTVLVVEAQDEKALRAFVSTRLGTSKPQVERVGDAEILSSTDDKRGAATFVGGYLLMGSRDTLRRCLTAKQSEQTLNGSRVFQMSLGNSSLSGPSHVVTYSRDSVGASNFILFVASQSAMSVRAANATELEAAVLLLPYAVSEMKFVEGGIERKTISSFGLLGTLATQFSTKN